MEYLTQLITSLVLLLSLLSPSVESNRNLRLVNNRYEGLVVKIQSKTPEDYCNGIIHGIKIVLSRFSSQLWKSTDGRASLGEVTVSIPKSWRTSSLTCDLSQSVKSADLSVTTHIYIKEAHPLYGNRPWTQQSQGCGRQGDFIQMGTESLRAAVSNESHSQTASQLLKEWIKFRWGIFDEMGHEGDSLYPPFYRDPLLKDRRPNKCLGNKNHPFCETKNHVPEAPTKHNAFCMGRPAWDIILQSEDFTNGRNAPSNNTVLHEPTFKFVQERSPRFVLAVEDTAVMNMQRRWEFVRKAVRRSVVYDIPDGISMGLVVFNSVAKTVAPLLKIDSITDVRQRIGSSLPRNPSTVPESQKCMLCAIQESIRILGKDSAGANIILVTTGSGATNGHQMNEIKRIVGNSGVKITPIIYPLAEKARSMSSSATTNLEPLIKINGLDKGKLFAVIDEGVGNVSKVSMMVSLMDALLAAVGLSGSQSSPRPPIIIHNKAFPGGISSMSTGSFRIDESLGKDARFSVYYYDLNHVGNSIKLTTPSGNVMASVNMQEEDGDANVIFVNIHDAERGVWKYNVENRADSHQGLHIQVTAYENPKRKITARIWTSLTTDSLTVPDHNKPIILYAEVKDGEAPVIEAQVQAKLQRLGTNATGYPYEPLFINLTDNGAGDPDITEGDGVYSRYLPQTFTYPGHYELSIVADHNDGLAKAPSFDSISRKSRMFGEMQADVCCGSKLMYDHLKPVAPFHREVTYGIINLSSNLQDTDKVPPSRILDFNAHVDDVTKEITLTWTAPGNDYDWGRAHQYEAVLAPSWAEAKAFVGENLSNLPVPHMVNMKQRFSFDIALYDQILYLAIRAIDAAGNRGSVSNIASIWIPHPPTTHAPITTSSLDLPTSFSAEPLGHGLTQSMRVANFENIIWLIASAVCLIVLVSMFITYCYCKVTAKNKKKKGNDCEKSESNKNIMIKTNSSIMLEQEDSRDSVDSAVKDVDALNDGRSLSPVQSWAASKLLAEHERRFSVSSGPVVEQHNSIVQYGVSIQEQFPDVTLIGVHPHTTAQIATNIQSDPRAYQSTQIAESYAPYPYPAYHPGFNLEELPPYTSGLSSQSSQASTAYTQEAASQPSDLSYTHDMNPYYADMPPFIGDATSYGGLSQVNYAPAPVVGDASLRQSMGARKVPPPVAPKPHGAVKPNTSPCNSAGGSSGETKRRNVTQV